MKIEAFLLRAYSNHIRRRIPGFIDNFASVVYARLILVPKIKKFHTDLNDEQKILIKYFKKHGGVLFPFPREYLYKKIKVPMFLCEKTGVYYTLADEKKLFFAKGMSKNVAKKYFRTISSEMDINSPHRYVTSENKMIGVLENSDESKGHCVEKNDVVLDIGACEGNFSLSVIETAGKIYLFEAEKKWCDALQSTFEPYKEKAEIVQGFVSDISENNSIKIDDFPLPSDAKIFVKIDVEGFEMNVLRGMEMLLKSAESIKLSIAVYHRPGDMQEIEAYIKTVLPDCTIEYTKGYAMFPDEAPYFRKTILRVKK